MSNAKFEHFRSKANSYSINLSLCSLLQALQIFNFNLHYSQKLSFHSINFSLSQSLCHQLCSLMLQKLSSCIPLDSCIRSLWLCLCTISFAPWPATVSSMHYLNRSLKQECDVNLCQVHEMRICIDSIIFKIHENFGLV